MITQLSFSAFEKILNAYLGLDPEILARLSEFQGKAAKLSLIDLKLSLYIEVCKDGFHLENYQQQKVITEIEGSSFDLFKMAISQDAQTKLISSHIKITGDLSFGQSLYKIMRDIDIDWEEHLSRLIGDHLAYHCMRGARGALDWLKKSMGTLRDNTQEYLQEEARLTPSPAEVEDFYDSVAKLRDDTDRLEHKISHLLSRKKNV